jgi:hypothetical protein
MITIELLRRTCNLRKEHVIISAYDMLKESLRIKKGIMGEEIITTDNLKLKH